MADTELAINARVTGAANVKRGLHGIQSEIQKTRKDAERVTTKGNRDRIKAEKQTSSVIERISRDSERRIRKEREQTSRETHKHLLTLLKERTRIGKAVSRVASGKFGGLVGGIAGGLLGGGIAAARIAMRPDAGLGPFESKMMKLATLSQLDADRSALLKESFKDAAEKTKVAAERLLDAASFAKAEFGKASFFTLNQEKFARQSEVTGTPIKTLARIAGIGVKNLGLRNKDVPELLDLVQGAQLRGLRPEELAAGLPAASKAAREKTGERGIVALRSIIQLATQAKIGGFYGEDPMAGVTGIINTLTSKSQRRFRNKKGNLLPINEILGMMKPGEIDKLFTGDALEAAHALQRSKELLALRKESTGGLAAEGRASVEKAAAERAAALEDKNKFFSMDNALEIGAAGLGSTLVGAKLLGGGGFAGGLVTVPGMVAAMSAAAPVLAAAGAGAAGLYGGRQIDEMFGFSEAAGIVPGGTNRQGLGDILDKNTAAQSLVQQGLLGVTPEMKLLTKAITRNTEVMATLLTGDLGDMSGP